MKKQPFLFTLFFLSNEVTSKNAGHTYRIGHKQSVILDSQLHVYSQYKTVAE